MSWADWLVVATAFLVGGVSGTYLMLLFIDKNWQEIKRRVDDDGGS